MRAWEQNMNRLFVFVNKELVKTGLHCSRMRKKPNWKYWRKIAKTFWPPLRRHQYSLRERPKFDLAVNGTTRISRIFENTSCRTDRHPAFQRSTTRILSIGTLKRNSPTYLALCRLCQCKVVLEKVPCRAQYSVRRSCIAQYALYSSRLAILDVKPVNNSPWLINTTAHQDCGA